MKYYIVDAFTDTVFKGNQAGVCLLDRPLSDGAMQNIAAENNLAETAFVVKRENDYSLRWFTPEVEIDLCGHGTLATAFILFNFVDSDTDTLRFETRSGCLQVKKIDGLYEMDFPARKADRIGVTPLMEKAVGVPVLEAYRSRDLMLLVEDERQVKNMAPDFDSIKQIPDCFGLIVTAKGDTVDFVSRFFAPNAGIMEDPVTGSSHCSLIPFWSERLHKNKMVAKQLSKRGGTLYCENDSDRETLIKSASEMKRKAPGAQQPRPIKTIGEVASTTQHSDSLAQPLNQRFHRVKIAGNAALYLEGEIKV